MPAAPFAPNVDSYLLGPNAPVAGSIRAYLQAVLAYSGYARNPGQLEPLRLVLGARSVGILASPLLSLCPQVVGWGFASGTVYAMAGTTNWPQLLSLLAQVLQAPAPDGVAGRVMQPYVGWCNQMYPLVAANLLLQSNTRHYWVGHSLGGVLCYLLAQMLQARGGFPCAGAVSFGAPRPGDKVYAAVELAAALAGGNRLVRYCADGDPITQVPPVYCVGQQVLGGLIPTGAQALAVYKHPAGLRAGLDRDGVLRLAGLDDSGSGDVLSSLWDVLNSGVLPSPHRLSTYIGRLRTPLIRAGRLSAGDPISGGPNGFLPRLDSAWLDLKEATGDTTPLFG